LTSGISNIKLRKAVPEDLPTLKALADAHRHELGFVHQKALLRSIEREEVFVAQDTDNPIAFVEYHHRKDKQTTIYHIIVKSEFRNQGIGRSLINAVSAESRKLKKEFVRIKCPIDLEANQFYRQIGCHLIRKEQGKNRNLAIWELRHIST
jgi:predicted GNAT family acetyltransferase